MAIRFFFEVDKKVIQLPVNPESIKIVVSGNNKTEELIKIGEINILRDPKLKTCNIESFLPIHADAPYVLTKGKFEGPEFYIDFFKKLMEDGKPTRFIISDTKINMLVSVENFEHGLVAGDDDVYYTLSLKQYKPYSSKIVTIKPATSTTPAKATPPPAVQRPKTGFAIGDNIIATGKYWYTSYGDKPFGTFNNFNGKISHIVADKKRKYRYHVTSPTGASRGWVDESQIKHK